MQRRFVWVGTAGHISVDITAGGNRIQVGFIEGLDGRLDLSFYQAVQLDSLARGDLDHAG